MKFKIENKDTGNAMKYNLSEKNITFKNEFETFIAEGIFSEKKIAKFENKIKKVINKELNEQLLGESDSFSTSIEIFSEIIGEEKINNIKYKELNPYVEEDLSQEMMIKMLNQPWYKNLKTIIIETYYSKIYHGISRKNKGDK